MRIAIIDDEKLIREGLKIILSTYEDVHVVGLGADGHAALEICQTAAPDLVLMDIRMPECDGVRGTELIKTHCPKVKVLILTTFKDAGYIKSAMAKGASGYLLKDSSPDLIYKGIKAALAGSIVLHPEVAADFFTQDSVPTTAAPTLSAYDLQERELEIIRLIAQGFSNREIAGQLYLSEGTVKNYVSAVLTKLDLRDRTQIAIFAFEHGLHT